MKQRKRKRDRWRSVGWGARELNIDPSTIRRWCLTGKLAHTKVGGVIRFRESAWNAMLAAGERKPERVETRQQASRDHLEALEELRRRGIG